MEPCPGRPTFWPISSSSTAATPPGNTRVCSRESLTRAQVAKVVAGAFGLSVPDDYRSRGRTPTESGTRVRPGSAPTTAQKNGFAGHIANSVGFVQEPDSGEGYVVAVLSNWWSHWERGVPVVEEISGWVSAELAR